jgi:hypothetical protein
MIQYIDYSRMSITQRLAFNREGICDEEFVLTDEQYQRNLAALCGVYAMDIRNDAEVKAALGIDTIDVYA